MNSPWFFFFSKTTTRTTPTMSMIRTSVTRCMCTKARKIQLRDQVLISPHPVSNLKLVKLLERSDESEAEKEYRIKFNELQEWNQKYWSEQNTSFAQEKEKFMSQEIEKKRKSSNGDDDVTLSYEELSIFYKKFLEDRQVKHVTYSWEWYCRHTSLLIPAMKSLLSQLNRRIKVSN